MCARKVLRFLQQQQCYNVGAAVIPRAELIYLARCLLRIACLSAIRGPVKSNSRIHVPVHRIPQTRRVWRLCLRRSLPRSYAYASVSGTLYIFERFSTARCAAARRAPQTGKQTCHFEGNISPRVQIRGNALCLSAVEKLTLYI